MMVWSSTACAVNAHALGMRMLGARSECRTDSSPRPVRCCADVF
jgi:hypothetical protein